MPASAALLVSGGPVWFWALKLMTVFAIGAALLLVSIWLRRGIPGAARIYRFVLLALQLATVTTTLVSFQNAVLSTSL
jgi:hypothetical protein